MIERFLAVNVSGISLRNAAFLLVDPTFTDEEVDGSANSGLTLTHYGFYKHSKTENVLGLSVLLKRWRTLIRTKTEAGPLMISEELAKVESYKLNDSLVVDMPLQSHIFSKPTLSVNETAYSLNYTFNINAIEWPLWEVCIIIFV